MFVSRQPTVKPAVFEVKVIFIVRVVQHGVEMNFIDARDCTDVAGHADLDLVVRIAVDLEQLRDLDRFTGVADIKLTALFNRALVDAEDAEATFERIDVDHEHVADRM